MLHEEIRRILKKNSQREEQKTNDSQINANESVGFGDTVEKFTHKTGLNKIAEAYTKVTGKDCGCSKRKDLLNKMFPYNR